MQKATQLCRAKENKVGLELFKYDHRDEMTKLTENKWLKTITAAGMTSALGQIPDLINGTIRFSRLAKPLYDYGLLYCNEHGNFQPVSSLAADVLNDFF